MSETKRTPGRWTFYPEVEPRSGWIGGISTDPAIPSPDGIVCSAYSDRSLEEDDANMKFIVRAVNAHEALVEAVMLLAPYAVIYGSKHGGSGAPDAVIAADEALKLAEE